MHSFATDSRSTAARGGGAHLARHRPAVHTDNPPADWNPLMHLLSTIRGDQGHLFGEQSTFSAWAAMMHAGWRVKPHTSSRLRMADHHRAWFRLHHHQPPPTTTNHHHHHQPPPPTTTNHAQQSQLQRRRRRTARSAAPPWPFPYPVIVPSSTKTSPNPGTPPGTAVWSMACNAAKAQAV